MTSCLGMSAWVSASERGAATQEQRAIASSNTGIRPQARHADPALESTTVPTLVHLADDQAECDVAPPPTGLSRPPCSLPTLAPAVLVVIPGEQRGSSR